jgi:hypothetical protein
MNASRVNASDIKENFSVSKYDRGFKMDDIDSKLSDTLNMIPGRKNYYLTQHHNVVRQRASFPSVVIECYRDAVFMSATCEYMISNMSQLSPQMQNRFAGLPDQAKGLLSSLQQELSKFFSGHVNLAVMFELHTRYIAMNQQILQLSQQGASAPQLPASVLH